MMIAWRKRRSTSRVAPEPDRLTHSEVASVAEGRGQARSPLAELASLKSTAAEGALAIGDVTTSMSDLVRGRERDLDQHGRGQGDHRNGGPRKLVTLGW